MSENIPVMTYDERKALDQQVLEEINRRLSLMPVAIEREILESAARYIRLCE